MKFADMPNKPTAEPSADRPYKIMKVSNRNGELEYIDYLGNSVSAPWVNAVILGLVRQRTLWSNKLQAGATGESCRSYDATTGYASPSKFDFEAAGFDPTHMPGTADGNKKPLPCKECEYRKWHDRKPPQCTEEWYLPLVMYGSNPPGTGDSGLYVLKLTMSAAKAAERFMIPYRDLGKPTYGDVVKISVNRRQKNNSTFSIPQFDRFSGTSKIHQSTYSDLLRQVREYMTEVPVDASKGFSPISMRGTV